MTVEAAPQVGADTGNPLPKSVQQQQKKQQGAARKEILASVATTLNIASLIMAVASLLSVVPFILIVELARELLATHPDTDRALRLLLIAFLTLVARGLLQAVALTWTHLVDSGFQLAIRQTLAQKLTRVPLGWFGAHSTGEIKKYLQDDVEALHYLVAHARLEFVGAVIVPLVTLGYLLTVDWRLTLILLLPLIVYAIGLSRMMDQRSRDRLAVYNRWERQTQDKTIEFVDGIQVVRAFGRAGKAYTEYRTAVDGQTRAFTRWKTPMIPLQSFTDVVISPVTVMLVIVLAGLAGVGLDWLEPLDLLPFLLVGLGLGTSLLGLGYGGQTLRAAGAAAVRLHELQHTAELSTGAPRTEGATPSEDPAGLVRFTGVRFGYTDDREVLHDIDLTLAPGTITALVGPSGSGKSTLAKLLPRFYDVTAGRITIGDRDIRDYGTEELYRTVGFVFQDVRLIRGSLRDNLLLAREDATQAEVERACRAAQIHDRITELPRGYDAEIGSDVSLSGGEAQRLSIARALLADTPVLVLDEATAFADPESEAAVQDALAVLVAQRTVLVIAHRLHTITGVDRILVLDNGELVEQGTHASLHTAGGTYQRLWETNEAALHTVSLIESEELR